MNENDNMRPGGYFLVMDASALLGDIGICSIPADAFE
jgi:hypothetical protein